MKPALEKILGLNGAKQARQIKVGHLWQDPSNLEKVLHRYCKQIFVLTDNEAFPYQFFGSGAAIKFGKRHLLFCTGHQISQFNPDRVAIYIKSANATITASSIIVPNLTEENRDTDWIDVRALEFNVENYEIPNLSSEFVYIDESSLWPENDRGHFFVFGYPTERQDVDYEKPHITARVAEVGGTYAGASHSPYVHRLKMNRKETFNADGMSGGPVFYLGGHPAQYFAGLAGIVIRGSATSDFLHFVEADFLWQMAQKMES